MSKTVEIRTPLKALWEPPGWEPSSVVTVENRPALTEEGEKERVNSTAVRVVVLRFG